MRIVDRKTFLSLPAGTLFAKAASPPMLDFGPLEIKGETVADCDFYAQRLVGDFVGDSDSGDWVDTYDRLVAGGAAACDFDIEAREGLFDDGQLFAVMDADDVQRLIARLVEAQRDAYAASST